MEVFAAGTTVSSARMGAPPVADAVEVDGISRRAAGSVLPWQGSAAVVVGGFDCEVGLGCCCPLGRPSGDDCWRGRSRVDASS